MKREQWLRMTPDQRRAYANPKRRCVERGCDEPAGTPWTTYWCADHDDARLSRISASLNEIRRQLA